MILFWVLLALLVAMALAILLPPLLRRRSLAADAENLNIALARERLEELETESAEGTLDPAQLDAARAELKRELLQDVDTSQERPLSGRRDPFAVAVVALCVPLVAFGLYWALGDHSAADGVPRAPSAAAQQQDAAPPLEDMVERLKARLDQRPADANGWLMLARTYSFLQRWPDAEKAFARAQKLAPQNPDVLVEYAGLLGRKADGVLAGQPEQLLRTALQAQPQHMNGLFLMGHVHFQAARYEQALELWRRVAAQLQPGSDDLRQLQQYMTAARGELGLPPETVTAAAPASAEPQAVPAAGKSIQVSVKLDPTMASVVTPGDTLFVYARATEGPRMPLAIARLTASQLPLTVTLDESMAMMPDMTLASFEQVTVEARISKTGSAMPQSGDIRGTRTPVSPDSGDTVEILIDSRVP